MAGIVTRISWESFDGLLPDGDLINVFIEPDAVASDAVEFRLTSAEDVTWWKGLLVPNGLGSSWEIWTHDSRTTDSVALWWHEVQNRQLLEFRKAKTLGVPTGVYQLGDLDRLAPGSRVTFQWAQDTWGGLAAWVISGTNLSLPFHDGRFWVHPGEAFAARVRVLNIAESWPWTSDRRYKLGSWRPTNNTTWGLSRVELPGRVAPVEAATFDFTARAPSNPGRYSFSWRMVQEGVAWFGESLNYEIEVEAPPPPPAPTAGVINVSLVEQTPSSLLYDGVSSDPSVTPMYPLPRRAEIESVRNATEHTLYLAHLDRAQNQAGYVLLQPYQEVTAPFATLEVEGRWRAQYRGAGPPPLALSVLVKWRAR